MRNNVQLSTISTILKITLLEEKLKTMDVLTEIFRLFRYKTRMNFDWFIYSLINQPSIERIK